MLDYELFNLRELIGECSGFLTVYCKSKGISINFNKDPEIDLITSDRKRVKQILINLVNNAVKFTEKDTVTITLASAAL